MVAAFAFASGGYFPTAWGWGALIALWVTATYVILGTPALPGRVPLTLLTALVLLAAWTWLALIWTADVDQTVLEGFRMLLYVSVAAALVVVVRREAVEAVVAGVLAGIFLPAGYGLITRLFPDRVGVFDPIAEYRLQEPVGYWNGLGAFAALGAALAIGFAARAGLLARCLAGAALPILLTTVYFTFSRGAWIALGVGLLAAVAVDPRRLNLIATALVLAPASALAVWLASQQDALTRSDAALSAAAREGHRLAVYVLLLAAASAACAAAWGYLGARYAPPRPVRLAFAGALAVVVAAAAVTAFVRYGDPVTIADNAWESFAGGPAANETDLHDRLFTFHGSYRVDVWEVALDQYADDSAVGSGPGTYEQYWNEHRPFAHKVRDAHNLYLEVLAELGPLGLALLAIALGVPLVGAFVARGRPLVPPTLAAYVVYLVHAGVDWDWELPALTVAALACGVAIGAATARADAPSLAPRLRWAAAGAAVVLAPVAIVGLVGASALSASELARDRGRWDEAEDEARKAARWWRWSPEPWTRLGQAQLGAGDTEGAARSFRKAVSKDRRDWVLWYDLASVTEGAESRRAAAQAMRLNRFYRDDLAEGGDGASD
jgi:tetratricopeptide (TPR) repeat protein